MKKLLALFLALCLPCAAMAETAVTANGVAKSAYVYEIVAPFTGVLAPFDLDAGQLVEAGDVLFRMEPIKIYAPADGVVSAVFAEAGELASDVLNQYGMLAGIEKTNRLVVSCTTDDAFDDADNRDVHLGEIVYIEEIRDRDNEGEGRVVAVDGKNYVVEVTDGDFDQRRDVEIYRDDKMTSKSCIGSGKVSRAADVPVTGNGRVLSCKVEEGDRVKKGQLMFELAYLDADADLTTPDMKAGHDGALELCCQSGQQVYKGMVLARVHDLSQMTVVAQVDEMDLDLAQVGETVTVLFDRYGGETFQATVQDVSRIGVAKQNATYYDVTLELDVKAEVLPGMNATIRLGQ